MKILARWHPLAALAVAGLAILGLAPTTVDDDPFIWLEDVQGEKALSWAKEESAKTTKVFEAQPEYEPIYKRTLEILDSKEKIPTPELFGDTVYNFWKDDVHPRGIWRRTTLASYRTANPQWETVLDIDALAKAEGKSWVFHGATCLPPANERCMIDLSPGGSDTHVSREFDTKTKQFVPKGFELPEAKSSTAWRDIDTLWVGTDFGPDSMTTSGYPRIVKLWKRGTPLADAKTIYEGKAEDVASSGETEILPDGRWDVIRRAPAFFRQEMFILQGDKLPRPAAPLAAQRLDGGREDLPGGVLTFRLARRTRARAAQARGALRAECSGFARGRGQHAGSRPAPNARQREEPPGVPVAREQRQLAEGRDSDARNRQRGAVGDE